MDKIIIFGNNHFAIMMAEYIRDFTENEVCCFTVDKAYIYESQILGLPVVDFNQIEKEYELSKHKVLIALGYKEMNSLRKKIFQKIQKKGYEITGFVHPSSLVNAEKVGQGNIFLENVFIGPHTEIGNANIFWNGANISHNATIGDFNYFSPSATFAGNVNVKNNCFFGTNCTIRNGLTISNKSLIGAGCYLNNNTLENEVYLPAKSVKIDKESNQINL